MENDPYSLMCLTNSEGGSKICSGTFRASEGRERDDREVDPDLVFQLILLTRLNIPSIPERVGWATARPPRGCSTQKTRKIFLNFSQV